MAKRLSLLAALLVAAAAGGMAYLRWGDGATAQHTPAPPPAVPVTSGLAEARDMPVYVRGLGTVQAYNAVAVRSRVDGQIVRVAFTEGQEVKTGDLLFEIDPAPFRAALDAAMAARQRDEAQLASVNADFKRTAKLVEQGWQTRQAYDQQKAQLGQLESALKSDDAQIETARINLGYTEIRAPIDGRSGARQVDLGNVIHANDQTPLTTITQLHPISVSFTVPQREFERIREAKAKGEVETDAYTEGDSKLLGKGSLAFIDNQIDQQTGTLRLKATFANADEALWPGEFVDVRLVVEVRRNAVTVPARTVERGPDGEFLFVVRGDGTVEMRKVRVFEEEQGLAVIDSGLAAGERVVVDGQYRLENGTRVKEQVAEAGRPT
jgi:multidrug efflux system membrane fusion protein